MKCMLFFGIALSIVIAVSFFLYWRVTGQLVQDQNPRMANVWVQQYILEKHWELETPNKKNNSGILPLVSIPDTVSSDFKSLMEEITKRIQNRDYEAWVIPNREKIWDVFISENAEGIQKKAENADADWAAFDSLLSKFPIDNPEFDSTLPPKSAYKFDKEKYHYFEEIRMVQNSECAICHSAFNPGELMGIVHIVMPESSMTRIFQKFWAYMLAAMIISVFLALVAVNTVVRWLVIRPLQTLRNVSESISRGELSKRVETRTGDEFEVLGDAFNRMLRYLVNTQDQLRKANNELESKVDELAHITIQLYETNRVKSDFMATMSHELRTPLNSILGFSDVLGSISTLTDKQKRYVENINKSGRSLLTMINDILDMAKMEAGRMEIQTAPFSIASTVAAQADMAKPLVDRKNIELETVVESNLPMMKQDESRIQQILNNLLSNAIKFTPEGGRIRLSVRRIPAGETDLAVVPVAGAVSKAPQTQDMFEIKVSDTGVGISEEDQQIIFEKFRQGGSSLTEGDTLTREHSGSGLGLSIVKEICKMLEGEISVESQLGIGSTFTVLLPWELDSKAKSGSKMMADIQQFAQNRVIRQKEREESSS